MDAFFDWRWGIIKKKMTLGIKSATLWKKILIAKPWGITFHSLLVTRWKLLVACNSLQNYSLLVAKNHSLLVAKFARFSLQKLLVTKSQWLLASKFASYSLQKWSLFVCNFLKKWLQHRCFPVNFYEIFRTLIL